MQMCHKTHNAAAKCALHSKYTHMNTRDAHAEWQRAVTVTLFFVVVCAVVLWPAWRGVAWRRCHHTITANTTKP